MKRFFSLGAALLLTGCLQIQPPADTVSVAATIYPLAYLAQEVGRANVSVTQITPAGVEPHDFEPSPPNLAMVERAKLLVLQGAGLDHWAENIAPDLRAKGVQTLTMTEHFLLLPGHDEDVEVAWSSSGTGTVHEHSSGDPHLWLDPVLFRQQAALIRDALVAVDPAHAEEYRKNASDIAKRLQDLDAAYRAGLAQCAKREIITSHDAFGYLAKRYGFTVIPISGLSPEEEPSPKRLAQIADLAKAKGITVIFFETLVPAKLAETIAQEIGATTAVLNPIEGITEEQQTTGQNYLTLMTDNLQQLRIALQCQ